MSPIPSKTQEDVETSDDEEYVTEFVHLEGPIKQFPEDLSRHVDRQDYTEFARSPWVKKRRKEQRLDKTYSGQPAKFVLEGDPTMSELAAGRFRCGGRTDQVVVVGIPDTKLEEVVRYVIVALAPNCRDSFQKSISGTKEWKGSDWNVWRPTENYPKHHEKYPEYYENVPRTILRVQGPASSSGKHDAGENVSASTQTSLISLLAQHTTGHDHAIPEQQAAWPTTASNSTKRHRLPQETYPDQSPRQKKARDGEKGHANATPTKPGDSTYIASGNRGGIQEPQAVDSSTSPSDGQTTSPKQVPAHHIVSEEPQMSERASFWTTEETHDSSVESADYNLPVSPKNEPLLDGSDSNMALASVKQEGVGADSLASIQTTHSARENPWTNVHSISQGDKPNPASVTIQFSTAKKPPASRSTLPSNASNLTGATDVIDLTDGHDNQRSQKGSERQIRVIFIDEDEREQYAIPFEKCNTAEDMFEEACVWDIADKETKMLEIKIPGRKPARVRKNNEENFRQKVFEPLKHILSDLGEGQSITLTVQKYMLCSFCLV